jgi:hypothetical protein
LKSVTRFLARTIDLFFSALKCPGPPCARSRSRSQGSGPGALSIAEFCAYASVGRTTAFAEIKAGRLVAHKRGRSTIILIEDADAWLNSLPLARPSASKEVVAQSKTLKKETRR